MKRLAALCCLLCLSLTACGIPGDSPVMRPGADCISCHDGQVAPQWTVAGTLFPSTSADGGVTGLEGGQVIVTDSAGRTLTLNTNSAGNFYTAEALQFPIHVSAQFGNRRLAMSSSPASGSCNSCHMDPPQNAAPGRLYVPQ